jgi:hypothetical protein
MDKTRFRIAFKMLLYFAKISIFILLNTNNTVYFVADLFGL